MPMRRHLLRRQDLLTLVADVFRADVRTVLYVIDTILLARLGIKVMLLIGMLSWCLRYVMFALGIAEELRWMIYIGIFLHGMCYDSSLLLVLSIQTKLLARK